MTASLFAILIFISNSISLQNFLDKDIFRYFEVAEKIMNSIEECTMPASKEDENSENYEC